LEINPGGDGVRYRKLANVSDEFEKLFRYLAQDFGIQSNTEDWVAKKFYNSSVGHDVEFSGPVEDSILFGYNKSLVGLIDFNENSPAPDSRLSARTLKQFISAGKTLEPSEMVKVGTFANGIDVVEWNNLVRTPAVELERAIETPIKYIGSVQGRTGTWYKTSDYFDLRDIVSGATVKCNYTRDLYHAVYDAFKERDAVVHVSGLVATNRIERRPLEVNVRHLRVFAPLSDEEFGKFYGGSPGIIGDESSSDFIDRMRRNGDA